MSNKLVPFTWLCSPSLKTFMLVALCAMLCMKLQWTLARKEIKIITAELLPDEVRIVWCYLVKRVQLQSSDASDGHNLLHMHATSTASATAATSLPPVNLFIDRHSHTSTKMVIGRSVGRSVGGRRSL